MRKAFFLIAAAALVPMAALAADPAAPGGTPRTETQTLPTRPLGVAPAVDADKLLGRSVQNPENQKVGEITSVHMNTDGTVSSVIMSIDPSVNADAREVALPWRTISVMENGDKVIVNMTLEQLKVLPEYIYRDQTTRGRVFTQVPAASDPAALINAPVTSGPGTANNDASTRSTITGHSASQTNADPRRVSVTDATPAIGGVSGDSLIGAPVRDSTSANIGTVKDILLDAEGRAQSLVVAIGGVMGFGSRYVTLSWQEVSMKRHNDRPVVFTDSTKERLKSLPEYKQVSSRNVN